LYKKSNKTMVSCFSSRKNKTNKPKKQKAKDGSIFFLPDEEKSSSSKEKLEKFPTQEIVLVNRAESLESLDRVEGVILPIESVSERTQREAQEKKELPVVYIDAPKPGEKQNIKIPKGGARVVVRGQEGQKVKMVPKPPKPQPTQRQNVRYVDQNGNPVRVQTGPNGNVVVVQQPQVIMADPYPYGYGYRRGYYGGYGYGGCYPYGGYYGGYGYGGFGTGLLLGAMLW
jgi:hypothetical protein